MREPGRIGGHPGSSYPGHVGPRVGYISGTHRTIRPNHERCLSSRPCSRTPGAVGDDKLGDLLFEHSIGTRKRTTELLQMDAEAFADVEKDNRESRGAPVKRADVLPMPFLSAWDPRASVSGSIDPLGALRPYTAIATTLLRGVTTITSRVRYLSWVCAGLRLLDELPNAPSGGRAGRARRQRILGWERLVALATGTYAKAVDATEDDPSWRQLRGVSYVRRAVAEGVRSPKFSMLRNQAGVGGVGTYWVTLVAGGLVEDDAGALTPRGAELADTFLRYRATPDRASLLRVISGEGIPFGESVLTEWGRAAHLGAASKREQRLLADALLEPDAHRRMASAMRATDASASDGDTFRLLGEQLGKQQDPLSDQLRAVLVVASSFEDLHRELLYRFNQVRASGYHRPVPLKSVQLRRGNGSLADLDDTLKGALAQHGARLPHSVNEAVHRFYRDVKRAVRAPNDRELVRALICHHERVQAGKLDASRQPKRPWVELSGSDVVIAPSYALDEIPAKPGSVEFTHPYRIEQFTDMLREAGAWESAS